MKKKLYKSRENRVLCGVCGGIGEYFNIDPVIVRIILVVLCCVGFSGIIAYILAAIIMPERPVNVDVYKRQQLRFICMQKSADNLIQLLR